MAKMTLTNIPVIDYDRLRRDYPSVNFIGLVGFDTTRQRFVVVKMANHAGNIREDLGLSEREQEVLQLVATGCTNIQIARKLAITENTVKTHLQNIFTKLKVQSRTEAVVQALQQGWVAMEGIKTMRVDEAGELCLIEQFVV